MPTTDDYCPACKTHLYSELEEKNKDFDWYCTMCKLYYTLKWQATFKIKEKR